MKKIYTLLLALTTSAGAFAQFFEYTSYRGAFGSTDWTEGWANWDPENTVYPTTTTTVNTDITANTTWTTGTIVLLQNKVYVTNNATLTIQPGVIIRGDKATEGTLIISKGSKIMAQGTSTNPIVFTSNFSVADGRAPGDWGGLVILGNAVNNQGSAVVEGGLDAAKAAYGGTDNSDNSGILSYVRIEFAGFPFQPDKEINGLTMGSVGSGTTIDHVQVSLTNDDGFEWFGGNVNAKYLISYRNVDDDFDSDFGYSGNVQYGLILRDPDLSDQCSCSTSEGFESDNDGSGTSATPKTMAVFSNITAIGPYRGSTSNVIDAKHRRALRIRRNSAISIFNSIFTDWPTGLHIDASASEANAINGELVFKSNILAGHGTNLQVNTGSTFDISTYFGNNNNTAYTAATDVKFVNPYPADFLNPDYRLQTGSPASTGSDFTDAKLGTVINSIEKKGVLSEVKAYPNPFIATVNLELNLGKPDDVNIYITDITGRVIEIISNKVLREGNNLISIDLKNLNNGLYFININSKEVRKAIKITKI